MLVLIKSAHIFALLFLTACVVYVLYSGFANDIGWPLVVAISGVSVEALALAANGWRCPLTDLAKKYGDESGRVTDIFFPAWFVPHVFQVYGVLFAVGLLAVAVNYFRSG